MHMRIISDPEIVVCVADAGGFRRAGLRLGLSQSNVSRRIQELERRIGQDLFARSGRAARLTEAGDSYLKEARKAVSAMAAAETEARKFTPDHGLMSITAPAAFGKVVVAPAVSKYASTKPGLKLNLALTDEIIDPAAFDLVVRAGPAHRNDLVGRVLFRSSMKLVATPETAAKVAGMETPLDLGDVPTIGIKDTRSRYRWFFEPPGTEPLKIDVLPRHVASDIESALVLCRAGLGVTMLPDWLVGTDLGLGVLVELLESFPGAGYPINVFAKSKSALTGRLEGVVGAIESEITETLEIPASARGV